MNGFVFEDPPDKENPSLPHRRRQPSKSNPLGRHRPPGSNAPLLSSALKKRKELRSPRSGNNTAPAVSFADKNCSGTLSAPKSKHSTFSTAAAAVCKENEPQQTPNHRRQNKSNGKWAVPNKQQQSILTPVSLLRRELRSSSDTSGGLDQSWDVDESLLLLSPIQQQHYAQPKGRITSQKESPPAAATANNNNSIDNSPRDSSFQTLRAMRRLGTRKSSPQSVQRLLVPPAAKEKTAVVVVPPLSKTANQESNLKSATSDTAAKQTESHPRPQPTDSQQSSSVVASEPKISSSSTAVKLPKISAVSRRRPEPRATAVQKSAPALQTQGKRDTVAMGPVPPSTVQSVVPPNTVAKIANHGPPSGGATPFTPGGVCLDLSSIFQGAETDARPRRTQPPRLWSTAQRSRRPAGAESLDTPASIKQTTPAITKSTDCNKDDWAEQQCEVFCNWLNFTFSPHDDDATNSGGNGTGAHATDSAGLRTLLVHRRMSAVRRAARELYASPDLQRVRQKLVQEISRGRIALRPDRDPSVNLSMRKQLLHLLLDNYSTPWLRIGLEAMFGVDIAPTTTTTNNRRTGGSPRAATNADETSILNTTAARDMSMRNPKQPSTRMKHALKQFIIQRVLADDRILAKYTKGKCKVPSGKFETEYREELRGVVLYRLVTLVCFLDRAKAANLLDKVPRLFTNSASTKSTRDVLLTFCREFLKAEGDFVRHLSRMGVTVSYQQSPVDELEYDVTNLAVDLRDGVRLGRLLEILSNEPHQAILRQLRLPAKSRLQKLHNVGHILGRFQTAMGISVQSNPHHIVDGHREMVLQLMWNIVSHCCLHSLVDLPALQEEIARIERYRRPVVLLNQNPDDNATLEYLLLRWSQAACGRSEGGCTPQNLSDDFCDGRAICQLIHFYFPNLLRLNEIRPSTRDGCIETIENERANCRLANSRISELGGIPQMIPQCDSVHPPEQKSVVLCLAFLCSRLLESSTEVRAARLIQATYRDCLAARLLRKQQEAARFLWKVWQKHNVQYYLNQRQMYRLPVLVLESFVCQHKARLGELRRRRLLREHRDQAAVILQQHVRGLLARLDYVLILQEETSAIRIQATWRGFVDFCYAWQLQRERAAAQFVQSAWRRFRKWRTVQIAATTKIQSMWRMFLAQRGYMIDLLDIVTVQSCARRLLVEMDRRRKHEAAAHIQCLSRAFLVRKRIADEDVQSLCHASATRIQQSYRLFHAQKRLVILRSVRTIQSSVRRYLAISQYNRAVICVILVQSQIRAMLSQVRYATARNSIVRLQSWCRMLRVENMVSHWCASAETCQRVARGWLARRHLEKKNRAASVLQSMAKKSVARNVYFAKLKQRQIRDTNVVRVQAFFRQCCQQRQFQLLKAGTIQLQGLVRTHIAQKQYRRSIFALVRAQSAVRRFLARCMYARVRSAVILLQSSVRSLIAVRTLDSRRQTKTIEHLASTSIQKTWRGYCARERSSYECRCAVVLQKYTRRYHALDSFRRRLHAVVVLQAAIRQYQARRTYQCLSAERQDEIRLLNTMSTKVQAFFRAYIVRRELARLSLCATKIQQEYRRFHCQVCFLLDVVNITIAQAVVRRFIARKRFVTQVWAVCKIQQGARMFLSRMRFRITEERRARLDAAICIQCAVRVHRSTQRAVVRRLELSAAAIQRKFRVYAAKKVLSVKQREAQTEYAACIIQGFFRCIQASHAFEERLQVKSACLIQSIWRMHTKKCEYQCFLVLLDEEFGAICIQRHVRGLLLRLRLRREAASTMIQKTWRCYSVHVDYMLAYVSAVQMQGFVRRWMAENQLKQRREAAAIISRLGYRALKLIRRNAFEQVSATRIQRFARMKIVRCEFLRYRAAAVTVQKFWRRYDASQAYDSALLACIRIQSIARMLVSKQRATNIRAMKTLAQEQSARMIQEWYNSIRERQQKQLAATVICSAVVRHISKKRVQKVRKSILLLQSFLRASFVRRHRSKRLRARSRKIAEANRRAAKTPQLQLRHRTRAALAALKSRRLSEIMTAIGTLEFATRYSRECALEFARENAFEVLFRLAPTFNRSLPHTEILCKILQTMANVARHDKALSSLCSPKGLQVLIDQMQLFRDKEQIFCLVVFLVQRIVSHHHDYQRQCGETENIKRLKSVLALCRRKLSFYEGQRVYGITNHASQNTTAGTSYADGIKTLQQIIFVVE